MGGAMQAAALFGFLVTLAVAVFKLDLKDNFSYLFVVLFCWMGMMVLKPLYSLLNQVGMDIQVVNILSAMYQSALLIWATLSVLLVKYYPQSRAG